MSIDRACSSARVDPGVRRASWEFGLLGHRCGRVRPSAHPCGPRCVREFQDSDLVGRGRAGDQGRGSDLVGRGRASDLGRDSARVAFNCPVGPMSAILLGGRARDQEPALVGFPDAPSIPPSRSSAPTAAPTRNDATSSQPADTAGAPQGRSESVAWRGSPLGRRLAVGTRRCQQGGRPRRPR